ncbi:MAG TPA: ParB/RepB/Spo0J family partition protein [Phycisphaerae bacterium]|nr:ParB/RepB/Spo0J family partition protein [Phycisphaerae bacterium]
MGNHRLGRGLDGLLKGQAAQPIPDLATMTGPTTSVAMALLDPNPQQPRRAVETPDLEQLAASIREHGVLQPIVVRKRGERYQIIAGERRFRAAEASGLDEIPVVVREVPDDQLLELALVENLQREDLDAIEKAESFKAYLESTGRTQAAAAARLGLDRSTIANMIRLLDLPATVQVMIRNGFLAMGHARAILAIDDGRKQVQIAERVAREGLSVRQVERLVAPRVPGRRKPRQSLKSPEVRDLERRLREALGARVSVELGAKPETGRIVIDFYSQDDVDRILSRLE